MKKRHVLTACLLLSMFVLVLNLSACREQKTEVSDENAEQTKTYTIEELAKYDGKDGNPAYIAIDGKVYDMSDVPQWRNGLHAGSFQAGKDYTSELKQSAPHGVSKMNGIKVVGTLAVD